MQALLPHRMRPALALPETFVSTVQRLRYTLLIIFSTILNFQALTIVN